MDLRLEPLTKEREADFLALMARDEHGGQCWCVAWWVPTWEEYVAQTPEEHRAVRDDLFAPDVHDGYLAYVEGAPVGWVQAGPRDDLPKIAETFSLDPDPDAWAISCFMVLAPYRGQGLGRRFFAAVLDDLREPGRERPSRATRCTAPATRPRTCGRGPSRCTSRPASPR